MRGITAAVAASCNLQLIHRDVVLDHLLLTQLWAGLILPPSLVIDHLMGPDPKSFNEEILFLWEHALHGGLSVKILFFTYAEPEISLE